MELLLRPTSTINIGKVWTMLISWIINGKLILIRPAIITCYRGRGWRARVVYRRSYMAIKTSSSWIKMTNIRGSRVAHSNIDSSTKIINKTGTKTSRLTSRSRNPSSKTASVKSSQVSRMAPRLLPAFSSSPPRATRTWRSPFHSHHEVESRCHSLTPNGGLSMF